jgi:hypothetical protein
MMQSLFEIQAKTDKAISSEFNKSRHNQVDLSYDWHKNVAELLTDYIDDNDQIINSLLESDIAPDVFRSMVTAHKLGNHKSMVCFAKSLSQMIIDDLTKKAEKAS